MRNSASADAVVSTRFSSVNSVPPAQSGSQGAGSAGEDGVVPALAHHVATSRPSTRRKAVSTAARKPMGSWGSTSVAGRSRTTTSLLSPSTSGRAIDDGRGVTSPIHSDDSLGVSSGTESTARRRRPAASA